MPKPAPEPSPFELTDDDLFLFNEGNHFRLYDKFGAHLGVHQGVDGVSFTVWAPDAQFVSVIGEFNDWDQGANPLAVVGESGIWTGFVAGAGEGDSYKYHVASRHRGYWVDKADPFAFHNEVPPATSSRVRDLEYQWGDQNWMTTRPGRNLRREPVAIYEIHLASWMRDVDNRPLGYLEVADRLVEHLDNLHFTHVEFLPVMEHPYEGSWGYQSLGYFAPTARFGTPQDFMALVDRLHQAGYGVILDWVPSHFAVDLHGLVYFDGTHLYEHADPRQGFHPDWGTFIFNYGRNEVRSFLLSSALFWLDRYHVDGLRVDAVASMLYLDYSRPAGQWVPNRYGGNENLESIAFLRKLNEAVYESYPGVETFAEESTAWPGVSRPTYLGGLGFGFKWDMGWMHDTLNYLSRDPLFRSHHHTDLTFRGLYAFTENYCLPLSHDEVVHGKRSLLEKMPGDDWQKFANLRLLFVSQFAQTGKKLLFMGAEIAQRREWNHSIGVDWHLRQFAAHAGVERLVADLCRVYRDEPALHTLDCDPAGFEWIEANDWQGSTLAFLRKDDGDEMVLVVLNATPVPRYNYRVGVPEGGAWTEILNSDALIYGGSGHGNLGEVEAVANGTHGRPFSIGLTLPPLAGVMLRHRSAP